MNWQCLGTSGLGVDLWKVAGAWDSSLSSVAQEGRCLHRCGGGAHSDRFLVLQRMQCRPLTIVLFPLAVYFHKCPRLVSLSEKLPLLSSIKQGQATVPAATPSPSPSPLDGAGGILCAFSLLSWGLLWHLLAYLSINRRDAA